jgi:hypothetical protein
VADTEDNIKDEAVSEAKNLATTPKSTRTQAAHPPRLTHNSTGTPRTPNVAPVAASPATPVQTSRRSVRTAMKAPVAAAASTPVAESPATTATQPPRKRRHSEKTESEDKEEKPEVVIRKRTRESWRDKEKEKESKKRVREKEPKESKEAKEKPKPAEKDRVKESARLKEREAAKDHRTPPKESASAKSKKQSKLDDILLKVTSRQAKFTQARQSREKRSSAINNSGTEEPQQNHHAPHHRAAKREVTEPKESPVSSRRGRPKAESRANARESLAAATESAKAPLAVETPATPPPKVDEPKEINKTNKKQPTIPDAFPASDCSHSVTPLVQEECAALENGKVDPIEEKSPAAVVAISGPVTESEAPSASPGEYEGGDEDDGEDEEFVPRSKVSSVIQSLDAAIENAERQSAEGQDATLATAKGDIETARPEPMEKPVGTTDVGLVETKRLVEANLRAYEEANVERVREEEAAMATKTLSAAKPMYDVDISEKADDKTVGISMTLENGKGPQPEGNVCEPLAETKDGIVEAKPLYLPVTPTEKRDEHNRHHLSVLNSHPSVIETTESQQVMIAHDKHITPMITEHHHEVTQVHLQPEDKLHSPESGKHIWINKALTHN